MSNQQRVTNSSQHEEVSRWPRLCRWLWKYPLPFLLLTIIMNVVINIGSTWLITPDKTIPATSVAGIITGWVSVHWLFSSLYIKLRTSPLDTGLEQGYTCSLKLLNMPGKVSLFHPARPMKKARPSQASFLS
jgi:hypothetical protein